jgi:hydrophobic/amphiphilic exporter-1 (mainly G- bacteria), HAE1 family
VEAVERHIEEGLTPKEAALKAMQEISGPVVGIALVLSAVFVPTAFIPGITGRLYQQFAVTIAISVILSAFNALSLSPALAALILKPKADGKKGLLVRFFGWFNRSFERATSAYVRVSGALLRKTAIAMVMLAGFAVAGSWIGGKLPVSFVPDEDQGFFYINVQLPDSASLQRTEEVMAKLQKVAAGVPGVEHVTTISGFSLLSLVRTSYSGFGFISMKEWGDRKRREEQFQEIKTRVNAAFSRIPEAVAFGFSPPAIPGVGTTGGFTFILEDRSGGDVKFLSDNLSRFIAAARKRP